MSFLETVASHIPDLESIQNFSILFPFKIIPTVEEDWPFKKLLFADVVFQVNEYFGLDVDYEETRYRNGMKNGLHRKFYRRGEIMREGNYVNDKKEGLWKFFNRDGVVSSEAKLQETRSSEGNYRDNRPDGQWIERDFDGQILRRKNYCNGALLRF
jgi:hypothetical protein